MERSGGGLPVVLIFRALQVGDMLCAVPALRSLRQHLYPSTFILIGLPWAEQLLPRYEALIDRVLVFPGHPAFPEQVSNAGAVDKFFDVVCALKADLAIQMHGSGEISNRIVESFGARQIIGFNRCEGGRAGFVEWPDDGHELRRCLAIPKAIGASVDEDSIDFPILAGDVRELDETGLPFELRGHNFVCIHPGARSPDRRWPAPCFAQIADALAEQGFRIVLTGSGTEWSLAEKVRQHMHHPALNAALPYSLGALAVLLRDAKLLICNDTGVSHLAAALRLPSVVIFTGSDPARWAPVDACLHRIVIDREGIRIPEVLFNAKEALAHATTKSG